MDSLSSSSFNFYGLGTNEWIGIVLSFDSQKEQLTGLSGWGWRYRVAIMGFHPNDTTVKDDEITYAICALGTCDGSGAGGRSRTPKISAGDVVLGKFLDGEKRQVPMITNVLGRTSGIKYGSGRFEVKSGFTENLKPGGLGSQEFNQNDNVVSGKTVKQQPAKGNEKNVQEDNKRSTKSAVEKVKNTTGVVPGQNVGGVPKPSPPQIDTSAPLGSPENPVTNPSDLDRTISTPPSGRTGAVRTNVIPSQEQIDLARKNNRVFSPFKDGRPGGIFRDGRFG